MLTIMGPDEKPTFVYYNQRDDFPCAICNTDGPHRLCVLQPKTELIGRRGDAFYFWFCPDCFQKIVAYVQEETAHVDSD